MAKVSSGRSSRSRAHSYKGCKAPKGVIDLGFVAPKVVDEVMGLATRTCKGSAHYLGSRLTDTLGTAASSLASRIGGAPSADDLGQPNASMFSGDSYVESYTGGGLTSGL